MTIWKKLGVQGDLQPVAQKGFGRVVKALDEIGEDTFVTAIRDGNHMPGSFHDIGLAWDMGWPKNRNSGLKLRLSEAAGPGFQFVWHKSHIHVEHDTVN